MRILRLLAVLLTLAACVAKEPESKPIRIDVWHDTVCPWCRIGLHNLDTAVQSLGATKVEIVLHPFLLEPDADGADMREHLAAKFGADRIPALLGRVSQAGAPYGVHFDWDRVKTFPNTAASHALVDWAPADRRPAILAAIQKAHFEEGRDIGDPDELARIAKENGLSRTEARAAVTDPARLATIRAQAAEAARQGISGVPHYELAGRTLEGAQSPETLRAALEAAGKR